jgi:thioredoxin reductase (NADPH)
LLRVNKINDDPYLKSELGERPLHKELYDVIIIGSGPAGLTAAIYANRAQLETLVIGGITWGGQLMLTGDVENFPGFPNGVPGPDLMAKMRTQAERLGVKILFEDATAVDFSSRPFKVKVGDQIHESKAVILATGASTKWLGLAAETRLRGRGVSACATCDAPFFKDKKTVVVGGGDTALDEALSLAKSAREVTVVHRRDQLRACKFLQERVFANKKINFVWNTVIEDILGKDRVEGVKLRNVRTGEQSTMATDGVFVAIGHKPNTNILKGQINLDENGYIIAHEETKTSVEGVFVAGDNQDMRYKQAITAAGAGCKAALDADRYLMQNPL